MMLLLFPFVRIKIMTTGGERWMLVTNNELLWERAWAYKDHGKSYDAIYRRDPNPDESFRWVHESFGTNRRMTEMQYAIGKLDEWVQCKCDGSG